MEQTIGVAPEALTHRRAAAGARRLVQLERVAGGSGHDGLFGHLDEAGDTLVEVRGRLDEHAPGDHGLGLRRCLALEQVDHHATAPTGGDVRIGQNVTKLVGGNERPREAGQVAGHLRQAAPGGGGLECGRRIAAQQLPHATAPAAEIASAASIASEIRLRWRAASSSASTTRAVAAMIT